MKLTCLLLLTFMMSLSAQKLPPSSLQALVEGNASSTVRVLIYEDLQCPDCADFRKMMDQDLIPRFKSTVAFEHRDFPLAKHAWARSAAVASRYFESIAPALAVEFRKATMAAQEKITAENFQDHLTAFATANKGDPRKAVAALTDALLQDRVEADYQEGVARGVARTPTVLVNGDPFIETFPVADIIRSIERELAAAKK
ncbi:MAG: thioredoxin domain-containing protein [Acidobacteriota bacterium]